jgi:hypothetical protein
MSEHLSNCNGGEEFEFHDGPDRCPACDEDMAAQHEAEAYAEFGSGWVTSGGDPADVSAAWAQDKALIAERDRERREWDESSARERAAVTRPKDRPVKGWRLQHVDRIGDDPFKGKWEYEPGCGCAKCENHMTFVQDCLGDWEYVE